MIFLPSDFKTPKRIVDTQLMRDLYRGRSHECALCGMANVSLHHILRRSQGGDDVEANLVFLCGSGTTGCHGLVEAADEKTLGSLGAYVMLNRPDTLEYLAGKVGADGLMDWMERRLKVTQ